MLQADAYARVDRHRSKEKNERLEKENQALRDAATLATKVNADQVSSLQVLVLPGEKLSFPIQGHFRRKKMQPPRTPL